MAPITAKVTIGDKINSIAWHLGIISYSNPLSKKVYDISAQLIGKAAILVNKEYKLGDVRKEVDAKWVALGIKKITPSLTYESGKAGDFVQRFVWQSLTSPIKNTLNGIRGINIIFNEAKLAQLKKESEELLRSIQRTFESRDDRFNDSDPHDKV
jgi:hypothetical protein